MSWIARALFPVLACAAVGCDVDRAKSIAGKVTVNGMILTSGTITFFSQDGDFETNSANIVNGEYTISNIPIGPAKVTVISVGPAQSARKYGKASIDTGDAAIMPFPRATRSKSGWLPLPERYGDPEKSELSLTIKPGHQTYDVELTSP